MFLEFALVFPVAIAMLFALIDGGRLLWTLEDASRVTAQTARCGAVDTTGACPNLVNYANSIDHPMSPIQYTASTTTCGRKPDGTSQAGVLVTATINFTFILFGPPSFRTWTIRTCYSESTGGFTEDDD